MKELFFKTMIPALVNPIKYKDCFNEFNFYLTEMNKVLNEK